MGIGCEIPWKLYATSGLGQRVRHARGRSDCKRLQNSLVESFQIRKADRTRRLDWSGLRSGRFRLTTPGKLSFIWPTGFGGNAPHSVIRAEVPCSCKMPSDHLAGDGCTFANGDANVSSVSASAIRARSLFVEHCRQVISYALQAPPAKLPRVNRAIRTVPQEAERTPRACGRRTQ
jgi:hypothetical protein